MDPQLHRAAELGNWDVITQFEQQLDTQQTPNKDTVLHVLAQFCDSSFSIQQILERKPELLLKLNAQEETSLHIAARKGHLNVVQAVIDFTKRHEILRSVLRYRNAGGNLALHEAIKNNRREIIQLLVKEDPALATMINSADETPLYLAVEKGDEGIVDLILSTCKRFPHASLPLSEVNLYVRAQLRSRLGMSEMGQRPLGPRYLGLRHLGLRYLVLRNLGQDQIYIGPRRRTALHAAAIWNFPECLNLILRELPHLTKKADDLGWTALHYAARFNHSEVAGLLLHADRSMGYVKAKKHSNETALHIAVTSGSIQLLEELLTRCPDCWRMVTSSGMNAVHLAVKNEQQELLDFILRKPWASELVNCMDANGNTPLHLYVATKKLLANDLLSLSVVARNTFNKDGLTPLDLLKDDPDQDKERQDFLRRELEKFGAAHGCPNIVLMMKDSRAPQSEEALSKMAGTYQVVATLIITICFAAAFTIPGGYESNDGPRKGQPVFLKKAAFIAFIVSDVTAMLCSLISLLGLLLVYDANSQQVKLRQLHGCRLYITAALIALVISFVTGLYVALPITGIRIPLLIYGVSTGLLFYRDFRNRTMTMMY